MMASRRRPRPDAGTFLFRSRMSTSVRLAYGLGPLIQVLEEHRVPIDPILEAAEIPRFALEEPTYRIRIEQESQFTRLALRELDLPHAGLVVGQRYHLNMFGILGLAGSCAPTILDALRTLLSYPLLAWGMFDISVWRAADGCSVRVEENLDLGECAAFFVERDMTCIATALCDVLGREVTPQSMQFRHSPPPDIDPYRTFVGFGVRFDQPVNELRFPTDFWDQPLPQANEMSQRFFENQCRGVSRMLAEPLDYSEVVKSRLRFATPIPSLSDLATALHLTRRTLQRRLASEGKQFSQLLREVRLEKAREYLRHDDLPLDEIADRLGFKDAVALSHAFKDWTGTSPAHFRRRLRAGQI